MSAFVHDFGRAKKVKLLMTADKRRGDLLSRKKKLRIRNQWADT
jgi:hypothetical protein